MQFRYLQKVIMKYQFKTNINCGGCIAAVTPCLNAVSDIQNWSVDTANPSKILTVETGDMSADQIREVVERAGYKAEAVATEQA